MVTVSQSTTATSSFKQQLFEEIAKFKELPNDWDGYGASPLLESNYLNAISLISSIREESARHITDFFPNPNGTLSIVWENSNSERVSLEIGSGTFSYYYKSNSGDPRFYNANTFNSQNYQSLDKMIGRVI